MRLAMPLIALMSSSASAAEPLPEGPRPGLVVPAPEAHGWASSAQPICRDRIEMVREERGLPRLQRDAASPNEPVLIAAVDHRIDGCSVLVMHGNTADVRPIPAPEGPARLQPIPAR
jgi:hypothetical protein